MTKDKKATFSFKLTEQQLWILTGVIAAVYFAYSFMSDGFYQHDEAAHYLNMRQFWYEPSVILGNWAKLGYKLIYIPVSLLGTQALVLANSITAALCCYLAYKLAEEIGSEVPLFAFVILAFQPFWIQLSFRNYSEIITALILVASVLSHYRGKYWLAGLFLSYTTLIRQELYPLAAAYGIYLLFQKDWKAALLMFVFPLFQNTWGWIDTGNPLYLYDSIVGTSGNIQDLYPRQGFWHYFEMSLTIFGGLSLTFFIVYLAQNVFQKKKWFWFIIIPLLYYFLIHVLFSIQSFKVGPSTGGNLRYLLVVSPLLAVLSGIGLERIVISESLKEIKPVFYLLIPFVLIVFFFLSFNHNNIVFGAEKDYIPFLTVIISAAILFIKTDAKKITAAVFGVAIVSLILTTDPIPLSPEDKAVKEYAEIAKRNNITDYPFLADHTMFYYYLGKNKLEFENGAGPVTKQNVADAVPGTIIIWDSHYSFRNNTEKQYQYTYFVERPEEFRQIIQPVLTPGQGFGILTFQKL